jgi:hypothetical protein
MSRRRRPPRLSDRGELCDPGIGKQDIDATELLCDYGEQRIQIAEFADVGPHGHHTCTQFLDSIIQ